MHVELFHASIMSIHGVHQKVKVCRDFKMYFRRSCIDNKMSLRWLNADCDQLFLVCSVVHCVFIALVLSLTESQNIYYTKSTYTAHLAIYSMIFVHLHLCIWKMKLLTLLYMQDTNSSINWELNPWLCNTVWDSGTLALSPRTHHAIGKATTFKTSFFVLGEQVHHDVH